MGRAEQDGRDAARRGEDQFDGNPHPRGTAAWFAWQDGYKDRRKEDGKDYSDGAPQGCPPWA